MQTRCRCAKPSSGCATAWSCTPARRVARLPDQARNARCACSARHWRRHRHRPLPGKSRCSPATRWRVLHQPSRDRAHVAVRGQRDATRQRVDRGVHAMRRHRRYAAWVAAIAVLRLRPHALPGGHRRHRRAPPSPRGTAPVERCNWTWACACRCWPTGRCDKPVNGQHPYASWIVVDLPVRKRRPLALRARPAAAQCRRRRGLPAADPANLIRQAFKFLGERYGWGHVRRPRLQRLRLRGLPQHGRALPRNTSDQAVSPALDRIALRNRRRREPSAWRRCALQVGDLVYIPGHVMMVIGHDRRHGLRDPRHQRRQLTGADGSVCAHAAQRRVGDAAGADAVRRGPRYVDRITNIQRCARKKIIHEDHRHPLRHAARAAEDPVQDRAAHRRARSRTSW
jgi:hypothetical protein